MPRFADYPSSTAPNNGDLLVIKDVVSNSTKNITRENILKGTPIPDGTVFPGGGGVYAGAIYKTSSGTYDKPADLKFVVVEVVGGGGGGGGVTATSGSQRAMSYPGCGGGYSRKKILASSLSASETVTIGAGGAGGAAGNNQGSAGSTTSFGSHLQATGGGFGVGSGAVDATTGQTSPADPQPSPGVGSGGDLNLSGSAGAIGILVNGRIASGPTGGASFLSGSVGYATNAVGKDGLSYGGGASGTYSGVSQTSKAGGAGAAGIVIIHEYF